MELQKNPKFWKVRSIEQNGGLLRKKIPKEEGSESKNCFQKGDSLENGERARKNLIYYEETTNKPSQKKRETKN